MTGANLLTTIVVKDTPTTASWDSRDGYLYVINFGSPAAGGNSVSIVDQRNNTVLATRAVGDDPLNSVYDPANGGDYVLNFGTTDNITVFNGTREVGTIPVGANTYFGLFDPANGDIYVSNQGSRNISIINGSSVIASPAVGAYPGYSAYDANRHLVYVPNAGTNNVSILNGSIVVSNINVGGSPTAAVFDPANGFVYICNSGSNNVTILNGSSIVANVPAGVAPTRGGYDPANGDMYIADAGSNTVTILNGTTTVANVSTGVYPRNVVFDAATGDIVIPDWTSGQATILNGTRVVATVSVGSEPYSAMYDPANQCIYVVNFNSFNVSVIGTPPNASTVRFNEKGLPSGAPWAVQLGATTYSTSNSTVDVPAAPATYNYSARSASPGHVAVNGSGSLTVVGNTTVNVTFVNAYPISFDETGLARAVSWNVSIGLTWNASANRSIDLWEPNGSYSYSLTPIRGYEAAWTGVANVTGAATTVNVTFTSVEYTVWFNETGLAGGTPWQVRVGNLTDNGTTRTLMFPEPNGSYVYSVVSVPGYALALSGAPFTVNGSSLSIGVAFVRLFALTFTATGLPHGGNWSVALGAFPRVSTNGTSLVFLEPNGSYPYTVATVAPGFHPSASRGNATVLGGPTNVTVVFAANASALYALRFRDSGLPANVAWTIRIANESNSTFGPSLQFLLANGTYEFLANATGYTPTPAQGPVQINGSGSVATSIVISFAATRAPPPPKFALVFEVSGLPLATEWGVAVAGNTSTTRNASLSLSEANGSYPLRILGVPGYEWVGGIAANRITWSGSVAVTGANQTFVLAFDPFDWSGEFHETGLPGGTSWNVTLNTPAPPLANGSFTNASTTDTLWTSAPNGSFSYVVSAVPGFLTPSPGTVTVSATPLTVNVTYERSAGPSTLFGLAPIVVFAAVGATVVVVALLAAALLLRGRRGPPRTPETSSSGDEPADGAPMAGGDPATDGLDAPEFN
ncbi:MAG: hypothetical protein ACHQ16_02600 [Candidatus Lutacidiplasmatales archaeon]